MHLMCTAIPSFPCLLCFMVISFSILCIFSYFLFVSNLSLTETNEILGFVAVLHYFLSPIFVAHGFIPVLLSNLLFLVAASYYHYLNFLGYDGKLLLVFCFYVSHLGNMWCKGTAVFDVVLYSEVIFSFKTYYNVIVWHHKI
uniref:Protein unc-50 homolog n=1 Tax=Rhizophora mucronata TaxID=61149 RepID=A0A2P2LBW9_RHIMU